LWQQLQDLERHDGNPETRVVFLGGGPNPAGYRLADHATLVKLFLDDQEVMRKDSRISWIGYPDQLVSTSGVDYWFPLDKRAWEQGILLCGKVYEVHRVMSNEGED